MEDKTHLTVNKGPELMVELLGVKSSQAAGITDPGRVFEANVSDTSRVPLLVDQYRPKSKLAA